MFRKAAILVTFLGALLLAHVHVQSQAYHPIVRVDSNEGVIFTAVFDATSERNACRDANNRFLQPMRQNCPTCELLSARCESGTPALDFTLEDPRAVGRAFVSVPGLRIDIDGPQDLARANCEVLAENLVLKGLQTAQCSYPRRRVSDKELATPERFAENRTTP